MPPTGPSTPLGVVRDYLAQLTGLPRNSFKLIHSGAVMKDDSVPISSYGIKHNSVIALIGSGDMNPDASANRQTKQPSAPPTEQSTLKTIQTEVENVRAQLLPDVTAFLDSISTIPSSASPSPGPDGTAISQGTEPKETPKRRHTRLAELLLQSLLRLDSILPDGEWTEVRSARKGAVKEVQGLLDRLDDGWRQSGL